MRSSWCVHAGLVLVLAALIGGAALGALYTVVFVVVPAGTAAQYGPGLAFGYVSVGAVVGSMAGMLAGGVGLAGGWLARRRCAFALSAPVGVGVGVLLGSAALYVGFLRFDPALGPLIYVAVFAAVPALAMAVLAACLQACVGNADQA